jgi:hypothetical protein
VRVEDLLDLDHHPDDQSRDAYAWLTTAIEAHLSGQTTPSLLGGPLTVAKKMSPLARRSRWSGCSGATHGNIKTK